MWTEWASLSLNKQRGKEGPPLLALSVFVDHAVGFSIPAVNLPLLWSGEERKVQEEWVESQLHAPQSQTLGKYSGQTFLEEWGNRGPRGLCIPTLTHHKRCTRLRLAPHAGHTLVTTRSVPHPKPHRTQLSFQPQMPSAVTGTAGAESLRKCLRHTAAQTINDIDRFDFEGASVPLKED